MFTYMFLLSRTYETVICVRPDPSPSHTAPHGNNPPKKEPRGARAPATAVCPCAAEPGNAVFLRSRRCILQAQVEPSWEGRTCWALGMGGGWPWGPSSGLFFLGFHVPRCWRSVSALWILSQPVSHGHFFSPRELFDLKLYLPVAWSLLSK